MASPGSQASGFHAEIRVLTSEVGLRRGNFDPYQNVVLGPYRVADGVLSPKPMPSPDTWEPMGDTEYRALYYALCMFNQVNRTGVEWKSWGPMVDESIYSYPNTMHHYFVTMFVFLDVFTKVCGPTARKVHLFQQTDPETWKAMIMQMREAAGGNEYAEHNRIRARQFMEMMQHWRREIGIPRDLHAALADFLPGMCNIFRIRKCVVMQEYDRKLAELGGVPVGMGIPDVPDEHDPQAELLAQAMLFSGDGTHKLGMMGSCADYPRIREKLGVAKRILGFDVLDLCVNGPAEKLDSMEYNGVAMYMAGWAAYEKFLGDDRENALRVGAVAGLEIGEYVALAVAGVFPFEVGLELALVRGKAMLEAGELVPDQAVCSVAGLSEERVEGLCQQAKEVMGVGNDVCQISTALYPRGYVVGGRLATIQAFCDLATKEKAMQAKVMHQKALHTPLMHPMQWAIKAKLREHRHKIRVPWCDVYFNADSSFYLPANGGDHKEPLLETEFAVTRFLCETCWKPLKWHAMLQTMLDNKITHFFECRPTNNLKLMWKRISKDAYENTAIIQV